MKFRVNLQMAWRQMVRTPFKSLLVLLATILGASVAVFSPALVEGGRQNALQRRQEFGTDRISFYVERATLAAPPLRLSDVEALRARYSDGAAVAVAPAKLDLGAQAQAGDQPAPCVALGTDAHLPGARDFAVAAPGRYFTAEEAATRAPVCVLEPAIARALFGDDSPVDRTLELRLARRGGGRETVTLEVLGVTERRTETARRIDDFGMYVEEHKGDDSMRQLMRQFLQIAGGLTGGDDRWKREDRCVHLPLGWFAGGAERLDWGFLRVARLEDLQIMVQRVKNDLTERGLTPLVTNNAAAGFFVQGGDTRDLLEEYRRLSTALYLICLALGAVVIVCVMLASVMERAREIGIRRVEGATQGDIVQQFLIEAVLYSVVGGVIGVCCYPLLCELSLLFEPSAVAGYATPWGHVALTLALVALFGLGAGVYPALRASRLDPVEALRHE